MMVLISNFVKILLERTETVLLSLYLVISVFTVLTNCGKKNILSSDLKKNIVAVEPEK